MLRCTGFHARMLLKVPIRGLAPVLTPRLTPSRCASSISTKIISSIEKLSAVDISSQMNKDHIETWKEHYNSYKTPPRNLKSVTVKNQLLLLDIDQSLASKISNGNHKLSVYLREIETIGKQVISMVPLYLKLFTADSNTYNFEYVEKELRALPVTSSIGIFPENVTLKSHHLVGINWLQDPFLCMKNIVSCLYDVNDQQLAIPRNLDHLENPLSLIDPVKVHSRFLFYQENEFQLPSIKTNAPVIGKLLTNSSIVPKTSKGPRILLEDCRTLGNLIYKNLVKRSILFQGNENHLSLYYLFINENYLQFLLENIPIYNGLIGKKSMKDLVRYNNNDLYYRQFGQYFLTIFTLNPVQTQNWILKHVENYMNIFNNLSQEELMEFIKDFEIYLGNFTTQIDLYRLKVMDFAAMHFEVPEEGEIGSSGPERDYLIELVKDYISFTSYKFGFSDNLTLMNKQKILILKTLEDPKHQPLLEALGKCLQNSPEKCEVLFKQFVSKLTKKYSYPFTFERSGIKARLPTKEKVDPLLSLALVNFNVSRSYFRRVLPKENGARLTDTLKKLSLIGYSYYRYMVRTKLQQIQDPQIRSELQRILLLKVFKTYVMEHSNLLNTTYLDKTYTQLIKSRLVNKYLLLKFGQVGFDQLIGALAVVNPSSIDMWVSKLLTDLVKGDVVTVGSNSVNTPKFPLEKATPEFSNSVDLNLVHVYIDKLDHSLQVYYDKACK